MKTSNSLSMITLPGDRPQPWTLVVGTHPHLELYCELSRVGISCAVVATMLCIHGCSPRSDDRQLEPTIQRGNKIVGALKQFRMDHGKYPETLSALSPKYLPDIPPPTWGLRKWQYQGGKSDFELRVDESVYTGDGNSRWLRYYDDKLGWQRGD